MKIIEKPYIVYSLPSGKVHQPLKSKKMPIAWQEVQAFLSSMTNAIVLDPDYIGVEIPPPLISSMNDPELKRILDSAAPEARKGSWKISSNHLIPILDYFTSVQPKLKNNYDLRLQLSYSFKLTDLSTKEILEHQELTSLFTMYFAKTHICLPTLFFPFQEAGENFWNYLEQIKAYLPFDLDEKYLRLARIKDGNVSSFKKITKA
ncbi:MAG TPA: hypothetical protein VNS32_10305 [Flavisolibacter sp.]|nr:hypothetical protein [Flavisolibacter sp.]